MIWGCIFWQIAVLQGWQMAMLLDKQISIFPVWDMATYPKWQICKSYPIVCTWLHTGHAKQPFVLKGCTNPALRGKTIALTLHMGVLSKMFAIKSRKNPARHIFPWLPGEVVSLHMVVLTKTFAMSVLYLKSKLNWGNRIKPGEADNFFTTACWCRSMIACEVSWISDEFWIY